MTNYFRNTALSASEDQPQIYVACLSSYTNGILYGEWLDATQDVEDIKEQIKQLLAKSPMPGAEEFAVHGDMGFGSLRIEEYESIEQIHEKALFIVEHGELGAEVLAYYGGYLEDAKEALEERYEGKHKSELDYATYLFDEIYLHDIPERLQFYIDYEQFKIDIFIDSYFSLEVEGRCHIFSQH